MLQNQANKSSFRESLKALEADVQHANSLAAALPRDYGGNCYQMRLSYSPFAPFILFLIEWMDYSCTDTLPSYLGLLHILVYKAYVDGMPVLSSKDKKATLREFYAVIYPLLRQLGDEFIESEDNKKGRCMEVSSRKKLEDHKRIPDKDSERDDECGICMENCTKMFKESEFERSLGTNELQRRNRHGYARERELVSPIHLHRKASSRNARDTTICIRLHDLTTKLKPYRTIENVKKCHRPPIVHTIR
ncbi:hypothetical protein PVK06_013272 [Gossypium arboreum]|uniref:Uncharacterized protein n=1 Tax=Gossypium arboreum TaxID=29729 RepID=A0ABR0QDT7_GOSAR|nr:hypothetical protein PVK06_013272 [Gossypium arboreum]